MGIPVEILLFRLRKAAYDEDLGFLEFSGVSIFERSHRSNFSVVGNPTYIRFLCSMTTLDALLELAVADCVGGGGGVSAGIGGGAGAAGHILCGDDAFGAGGAFGGEVVMPSLVEDRHVMALENHP